MAELDLVEHLLRRAGFSGSPEQLTAYAAKGYDAAVDDTTSYIPRLHTLHMRLEPSAPGAALRFAARSGLCRCTAIFAIFKVSVGSWGLSAKRGVRQRHEHHSAEHG